MCNETLWFFGDICGTYAPVVSTLVLEEEGWEVFVRAEIARRIENADLTLFAEDDAGAGADATAARGRRSLRGGIGGGEPWPRAASFVLSRSGGGEEVLIGIDSRRRGDGRLEAAEGSTEEDVDEDGIERGGVGASTR